MKIFDINGDLVSIDVRPSRNPVKYKSKSNLQGKVGLYLSDKYPHDVLLEEFYIPGSRSSVDFFMPKKKLVVEVNGRQHDEFVPHFHGNALGSNKFIEQKKRDSKKVNWAEMNGFKFVEIRSEDDFGEL